MIEVRKCTPQEKKLKINMEYVTILNGGKQYFTKSALRELQHKIQLILK